MRKPLFSVTKKDFVIQTFSAGAYNTPLSTPCNIWNGNVDKDGYGKVTRGGKSVRMHRAIWEDAHGPIPDDLWVLHHCDNPSCINIDHLYLGTHTDNMRDRKDRGRTPDFNGELHPVAKLTNAEVAEIRRKRKSGIKLKDLCVEYNMSMGSLSEIVNGKRYRHQNKSQTGVRIVHKASGARGEARDSRSQKQNKEAAFVRMATSPQFQAWLKTETARRLQDQHELHRRVNRQVDQWIAPKNLKVEMLRDGKWIEAVVE